MQLSEEVRYVVTETLSMTGVKPDESKAECVAGNWNPELLTFLSHREFWQASRIRLRALLQ